MLHAVAQRVSSRAVPGGTEYLFEAEDNGRVIKVYVLDLEGKEPVFTQVVR